MIATFVIYYGTLILFSLIYCRRRIKQNFGICDAVILSSWVLCAIGGWLCSYGYVTIELRGFRLIVFWCYLCFIIITVIGFVIGGHIRHNYFTGGLFSFDKKVSNGAVWIIFVLITGYFFSFLYFIRGNIPILSLFNQGAASGVISRMKVTHNIRDNYDLPVLYNYRKLITEVPLSFLLCLSYVKYLRKEKNSKSMFFCILLVTVLSRIYTLEKSGVINILIILLFSHIVLLGKTNRLIQRSMFSKKEKQIFIRVAVFAVVLMIGMYMLAMGNRTMGNAAVNVLDRIVLKQTGYIYDQDIILNYKYGGSLRGREISLFIIDKLLHRDKISLSEETYISVYTAYSSQGFVGTTGTMPVFYLYSNAGFALGIIIYSVLCVLTGFIDRNMSDQLNKSNDPTLTIAVYVTLMQIFYQGFISDLSNVYMLPFVFSPKIIILIILASFVGWVKIK